MAELFETAQGPESEAAPAGTTDNAAVAIALDRARRRKRKPGASDDEVDRFLTKQEALIEDQRLHLHEQLRILPLDRWSRRLQILVQGLTVVAGLAVLGAVGWMVISAATADGLSIKPFSTPPALAERGVTGEAVASRIMDRLNEMADTSRTSAAQQRVTGDWGQNVSIEIPQTGISLSQLEQWLREKLGRQRRISGELNFNPDGTLELDARIAGHPLPAQSGAETDLNLMITKVAEAIYAREQPSTYYLYLAQHGRWEDAFELGKMRAGLADSKEPSNGLFTMGASISRLKGDFAALPYYERSLAAPHSNFAAASQLAGLEFLRGHWERAHQLDRRWLELVKGAETMSAEGRRAFELSARATLFADVNDYAHALPLMIALDQNRGLGIVGNASASSLHVAETMANLHDIAGAAAIRDAFEVEKPIDAFQKAICSQIIAARAEDWPGVVAQVQAARAVRPLKLPQYPAGKVTLDASEGLAQARLGHFAEAHALLDPMAADNVDALLARGVLAQAENKPAEADRLFAEAVRLTPSMPEAIYSWARLRLERGQAREALALFDRALRISPNYADARVGRGEAALILGDAKAAVRDFSAAGKLTPKWGRLHLKWATALARLGKTEDARAQLKTAAGLYLTPTERAQLSTLKL